MNTGFRSGGIWVLARSNENKKGHHGNGNGHRGEEQYNL